ncbi:hypothetical protein CPB84DRAFT_1763710 [Gymnopilus junonius]|uniref:ABC transporter domain-containing protein n=1 Tax=Gymnopilus junonius TaxID=109634 RepID=A0A9P5P0R8_GYMJU|nr:hypothetical protein CPB84DRAFT_1763710 [Gymnopilus junonius]
MTPSNRTSLLQTDYNALADMIPPAKCPPCFNCMLPAFTCGQFAECSQYNGQCNCPPGWAGIDCLQPQCDSLADGEHRRPREDGKSCECKDGWEGINCNVCKNDNACVGFPLAGGVISEEEEVANMTCYKGGETVFNNHQFCDVTNRKILDMLPDRPPQVTFSCTAADASCAFQFWTAQVESFYCALDECTSTTTPGYSTNSTVYDCAKIQCKCVPGRFICGENGSVDISDFLTEEIKGPAKFSCKSGQGCRFEEPAMNDLIDQMFGDPYITLMCEGGECLHYSQVPGYVPPPKPDNRLWVGLSVAGALLFVLLSFLILWYSGRSNKGSDLGQIRLPENETTKLMTEHIPASLHFSDLTYTLPSGQRILSSISGSVQPGQVLAIMGASGAGKSTLLDILARKRKLGSVTGTMLVNGREVSDREFRDHVGVGYVDQEDTLMSTLTVYESVLYSALLRLPREMSFEAKRFRTLETMQELGILGIGGMRIGKSGQRTISGGEKRRVSIACELVTSPSILFLDEPTSGLDAYNAYNVIDSLVSLAKNYNRTVIFTIHQPRSNIVSLFDRLVVLGSAGAGAGGSGGEGNGNGNGSNGNGSNGNGTRGTGTGTSRGGEVIYSGDVRRCASYFESVGLGCPPGFNIADYLIDLTMQAAANEQQQQQSGSGSGSNSQTTTVLDINFPPPSASSENLVDAELGLSDSQHIPLQSSSGSSSTTANNNGNGNNHSSTSTGTGKLLNDANANAASITLSTLVGTFAKSEVAAELRAEGEAMRSASSGTGNGTPLSVGGESGNGGPVSSSLPDVVQETSMLRGRKRASWGTQFRILSGRAFKNLYRDPALLTAHYSSAIALAVICGLFYHNVTLGLFANERILFMRERANGYYSSFTYFASKILFDILPLRLIPPLMFGGIVYGLVGLVPTVAGFWKFMLTLVLFNLTTASVVLLLSVAFASVSVASLVGTLIMLFNLLFTGLLINRESVTPAFRWLHTVSFFHAAFEALAVNELRYLQLKEVKYGVELDVPAATILSVFGLRAQSFWWPNISLLVIFFVTFTTASFFILHFYVKERR